MVVAHGWHGKTWGEVVALARSSPNFQATLVAAKKKFAGTPSNTLNRDFAPEELTEDLEVTVTLARSFDFMLAKEFETKNGISAEKCGLELKELVDDTGDKVSGVLIARPEPRKVNIEVKQGIVLSKTIASSTDMLRPGQNKELLKYLLGEKEKKK
eukprot:499361-Amphidinium_carterae.1